MNLELLIAILFGGLLIYRGLFSLRRTRMRIAAMSLGTLIIVTVVSVNPQGSVSQTGVSNSRHSPSEQESRVAIKLYQNQINSEIKTEAEALIKNAQARPFHKKSPEDFLVLASREYEQNNIDTALDFAYAGLHLNPNNKQVDAALSNITGMVFSSLGLDDFATVRFEEAVKKFPYDADTHNHLGILYFEQKDFNKAEEKFKKALTLRPKDGRIYYNLGNLFKEQNSLRKAEKTFKHAIKVDPQSPDLHNGLGTVLWAQDKQADAEKEFQKAMELSLGYGLEPQGETPQENKDSKDF
ncbi:MAG: tetratricopeptide repeat protein [Nitrospina sp.]|jgi:Tfp pilus assembly protein PilF|nr:tetratricopeptide repeat protein [Nitrospina sp.]MBT6718220.1 tetratricopeptide repeat protein [Nitrospina sp.]